MGVDSRLPCSPEQQRMPIGRSLHYRLGAEHRASAGLVVHNHGLAQAGPQLFGQDARDSVHSPPRRKRHNYGDGLRGVRRGTGLRLGGPAQNQRSSQTREDPARSRYPSGGWVEGLNSKRHGLFHGPQRPL